MKIVRVDNFNRETISDRLVAENIQSTTEAAVMLEALLATCTDDGPNWYIVAEDDYELYKFEL